MARPKKENLDYFPLDSDFFTDTKIKILKAKYGADGIAVYLYILCEIYHDKGYYVECDEDFMLVMSDYFNFSTNKTMQILKYLFSRSLLVKSKLSESVTVITAKSVQRRYQAAKKASIKKEKGVFARDVIVDERIWLLKKEETEPPIKVQSLSSLPKKNDNLPKENYDKSIEKSPKESKVKESKVKESKVCAFELPCKNGSFGIDEDFYTELTHTYPDMDVKLSLSALKSWLLSNPEKQRYKNAVSGQISWWLSVDDQGGKYRKPPKTYGPTYDIEEYERISAIDEDDWED